MTPAPGRDRIRELLDAVLGDDNHGLADMAAEAHSSTFHFSRAVSAYTGEAPVTMRRRVMLERAAWYLRRGEGVTDVAFDSGFSTVEGFSRAFSRAFGHPPSSAGADHDRGHWLPAPNGIHFHSPTVLYISQSGTGARTVEESAGAVTMMMVRHDLDDITSLLDAAKALAPEEYRLVRRPGEHVIAWQGGDESIAAVLHHLVAAKLPWLACIEGADQPDLGTDDITDLIDSHQRSATTWLAALRDIERRDAWGDRVIDALCDPPESFTMAQIVAHVLTFSVYRRLLLRSMLAQAGVDAATADLDPDPIIWQRRHLDLDSPEDF